MKRRRKERDRTAEDDMVMDRRVEDSESRFMMSRAVRSGELFFQHRKPTPVVELVLQIWRLRYLMFFFLLF